MGTVFRIGAAGRPPHRVHHRQEGLPRQWLEAGHRGDGRHAKAELLARRNDEQRRRRIHRGGPAGGIEVGQVAADAGEDAVDHRAGIGALAQQRKRHRGDGVLAVEELPGGPVEAWRFPDGRGRHQPPAIGVQALGVQALQHGLVGVDIADQHGEVDAQLFLFLLQDALGAPIQHPAEHQQQGQHAEQRDVQPTGSAYDFY